MTAGVEASLGSPDLEVGVGEVEVGLAWHDAEGMESGDEDLYLRLVETLLSMKEVELIRGLSNDEKLLLEGDNDRMVGDGDEK